MKLDLALTPETAALYDALILVPLGATVTYAELTAVVGRDVTGHARPRLISALRIALRDNGAAFATVRGVGLRRLLPDDAPDIGQAARKKLRRTSQRAIVGMTAVASTSNGLSPEAQRRLSAELSTHGLLAEIATDKAVAKQASDGKVSPPALAGKTFLDHIGATK